MIKDMVSCVIPTYKRSDSLNRAVNSALKQTYKQIEVIVVDDNNLNDEYSLKVQQQLSLIKDSRLRYIQQEKHLNGAVARNVGINESKGEFIAFLDDDDEWLDSKLELQIKKLQQNPNYGGISCFYTYYNDGLPIRKNQFYNSDNLYKKVLDRTVSVCTPTLLFRKSTLNKTGYFDEKMSRHQDLQLLLDFLEEEKLLVLPEYLVLIHTEVGGNRPNTKQFIEVKNVFFTSMKSHFNNLEKKERKRSYAAHYFEIILMAIREKEIKVLVKYLLKIGFNPRAYIDLYNRTKERQKNKI